jgi:glycerol-3-phosphate dehydrogenase
MFGKRQTRFNKCGAAIEYSSLLSVKTGEIHSTHSGNALLIEPSHGKQNDKTEHDSWRRRTMTRSLATQLLVVGGGATGLGVAWDASLRGIKTVVIEQGDLGQGTSGRYHGLLHSGGRYVISDPQSARECAQENQILRRIAPAAIESTGGLFVSTLADPPAFADRWVQAANSIELETEEIEVSKALELEPHLNQQIRRAFHVQDASLDSFDLLHDLTRSVQEAGGDVWLRHRLESIEVSEGQVVRAIIRDLTTDKKLTLGLQAIVNAAGPWANQITTLAGVDLPIALGRGVMIALAMRRTQHVVNRCRPPGDGDIIVPVGTVAVLGTTDQPVDDPSALHMETWEIDLLMSEGDILLPGIINQRPLRAWAGIRPLYQPKSSAQGETRSMTRAHAILDHASIDGCSGLYSVFGGKLTTFRLMAQETVDLVCRQFRLDTVCSTATTPLLSHDPRKFYRLSDRPMKIDDSAATQPVQQLICECEMVGHDEIMKVLLAEPGAQLDDLRRDLRLGMGPCQGGFCSYRAAGLAYRVRQTPPNPDFLLEFLNKRWRGVRPLAWGNNLRQMELSRRIYYEHLAADTVLDKSQ